MCYAALPFLVANCARMLGHGRRSRRRRLPNVIGKRVVVLGGGDTAWTACAPRCATDAESVTCVYRRDEVNMPGSRREVKYSRDEGVQFLFQRQPLEILGDARGVTGVRVAETRLAESSSMVAEATAVRAPKSCRAASRKCSSRRGDPRRSASSAEPPLWAIAVGIELERNGKHHSRRRRKVAAADDESESLCWRRYVARRRPRRARRT